MGSRAHGQHKLNMALLHVYLSYIVHGTKHITVLSIALAHVAVYVITCVVTSDVIVSPTCVCIYAHECVCVYVDVYVCVYICA